MKNYSITLYRKPYCLQYVYYMLDISEDLEVFLKVGIGLE